MTTAPGASLDAFVLLTAGLQSDSQSPPVSASLKEQVYKTIFDKYSPLIYGFLLRHAGDSAIAQALLAQTFDLLMEQQLPSDEGPGAIARLMTCAKKVLKQHVQTVYSEANPKISRQFPATLPAPSGDHASGVPELAGIGSESLEYVISRLFDDLYTQEEIAREISKPLSEVRKMTRQALLKVRSRQF